MNYQQTVEYLYNSTPVFEKIGAGAYKEGLSTTLALDEHLGHPHQAYATIHVAGTNGKGSVSHTLAAILQASGLKVGLFTSPHLVDFRERIRVNGRCVSQRFVIDFVKKYRPFFEPLHPSFFELTTAMAFLYFAEKKVDVAVIEVGLGGRLDCTNIIIPKLSVITNISLDHTQFLGTTLPQIAAEKAGILKSGVPALIGEATVQTRPVFEETALRTGSPILFAQDQPAVESFEHDANGGIIYHTQTYGQLYGQLGGDYQARNTNTILKAVDVLRKAGFTIGDQHVANGMAHVCSMTGLLGRWQKLNDKPTVICDTGHNVGGWQYLSQQISRQSCRTLRIVFGMVDDKDIHTVMQMLPQRAQYYYTKASSKRAISEQEVMRIGQALQLTGTAYPTVSAAYRTALQEAAEDDFIFVGGSSYVVADLLAFLQS